MTFKVDKEFITEYDSLIREVVHYKNRSDAYERLIPIIAGIVSKDCGDTAGEIILRLFGNEVELQEELYRKKVGL